MQGRIAMQERVDLFLEITISISYLRIPYGWAKEKRL